MKNSNVLHDIKTVITKVFKSPPKSPNSKIEAVDSNQVRSRISGKASRQRDTSPTAHSSKRSREKGRVGQLGSPMGQLKNSRQAVQYLVVREELEPTNEFRYSTQIRDRMSVFSRGLESKFISALVYIFFMITYLIISTVPSILNLLRFLHPLYPNYIEQVHQAPFRFNYSQSAPDSLHNLHDSVRGLFYLVQTCVFSSDKLIQYIQPVSLDVEFVIKMYVSDRDTLVDRINQITLQSVLEEQQKLNISRQRQKKINDQKSEQSRFRVDSYFYPNLNKADKYRLKETELHPVLQKQQNSKVRAIQNEKLRTLETTNNNYLLELSTLKQQISQLHKELETTKNLNGEYCIKMQNLQDLAEVEKSRHKLLEQALGSQDSIIAKLKQAIVMVVQNPSVAEYIWLVEEQIKKQLASDDPSPALDKIKKQRKRIESELLLEAQAKHNIFLNNQKSNTIIHQMQSQHMEEITAMKAKYQQLEEDYRIVRKMYEHIQKQYNDSLIKLNLKNLQEKWLASALSGIYARAGFQDYDKRLLKKKTSNHIFNKKTDSPQMVSQGLFGSTGQESILKENDESEWSQHKKGFSEEDEKAQEKEEDLHSKLMKMERHISRLRQNQQKKDRQSPNRQKLIICEQRIAQLNKIIEKQTRQKEKNKQLLAQTAGARDQLELEVEKLKAEVKILESEKKNQLLARSAREKKDLEARKSHEKELEELRRETRQVEERFMSISTEYVKLNNEYLDTKSSIEMLRLEAANWQRGYTELETQLLQMEEQNTELKEINMKLQTNNQREKGKMAQLQGELHRIREQASRQNGANDAVRCNHEPQCRLEVQKLESDLVQIKEELERLLAEKAEKQEEALRLQKELEKATHNIMDLQEQLRNALDASGNRESKSVKFRKSRMSSRQSGSSRRVMEDHFNDEHFLQPPVSDHRRKYSSGSNFSNSEEKCNILDEQYHSLLDTNANLLRRIKALEKDLQLERQRNEELINEMVFQDRNIHDEQYGLLVKNKELEQVVEVQGLLIEKYQKNTVQQHEPGQIANAALEPIPQISQEASGQTSSQIVSTSFGQSLGVEDEHPITQSPKLSETDQKLQYLTLQLILTRQQISKLEVELLKSNHEKEALQKGNQAYIEKILVQQSRIGQLQQDLKEQREDQDNKRAKIVELMDVNKDDRNTIARLENNILEYINQIKRLREHSNNPSAHTPSQPQNKYTLIVQDPRQANVNFTAEPIRNQEKIKQNNSLEKSRGSLDKSRSSQNSKGSLQSLLSPNTIKTTNVLNSRSGQKAKTSLPAASESANLSASLSQQGFKPIQRTVTGREPRKTFEEHSVYMEDGGISSIAELSRYDNMFVEQMRHFHGKLDQSQKLLPQVNRIEGPEPKAELLTGNLMKKKKNGAVFVEYGSNSSENSLSNEGILSKLRLSSNKNKMKKNKDTSIPIKMQETPQPIIKRSTMTPEPVNVSVSRVFEAEVSNIHGPSRQELEAHTMLLHLLGEDVSASSPSALHIQEPSSSKSPTQLEAVEEENNSASFPGAQESLKSDKSNSAIKNTVGNPVMLTAVVQDEPGVRKRKGTFCPDPEAGQSSSLRKNKKKLLQAESSINKSPEFSREQEASNYSIDVSCAAELPAFKDKANINLNFFKPKPYSSPATINQDNMRVSGGNDPDIINNPALRFSKKEAMADISIANEFSQFMLDDTGGDPNFANFMADNSVITPGVRHVRSDSMDFFT